MSLARLRLHPLPVAARRWCGAVAAGCVGTGQAGIRHAARVAAVLALCAAGLPAAVAEPGAAEAGGPLLREGRAVPRRGMPAASSASAPVALDLTVPGGVPLPAQRASAPLRRPVASTRGPSADTPSDMDALRQRISERLRQIREREEAAPAAKPRRAAAPGTASAPAKAVAAHRTADALDPGEVRIEAPIRAAGERAPSAASSSSSASSSLTAPLSAAPAALPGGPAASGSAPAAAVAGAALALGATAPAAAPAPARSGDPSGLPWAYAGPAGPQAWGRLKPEYALCARGQRQSPIALREGLAVDLDPLGFDYPALPIAVHDTGRGLEVTVRGTAALVLRGERYPLVRLTLHRPGQGSIDGRRYPMSVQLLHRDAQGRQVMVALMVEPGGAQPAVQQVLNNLPLEPGTRQAAVEPLSLGSLLPAERGYWTYMGSLTEPPCTEGVLWVVLKQPITMSAEQLALFARLHAENARPDQPAAGRRIKVSR